jgi:Leucine-rich repeat (LRR) protein
MIETKKSNISYSLPGPLLRALNDSFSLIVDQNEVVSPKAFQVTKNYNAKSDVFRELQFIYDFVQKTIFLSLNLFMHDEPCDYIDISKFRNLRKIEVNRIAIDKVYGLKVLRPQMCEVHCIRSLAGIEEIVVECGGDKSEGHLWNELKVADFSYNGLTKIDNAFEFTPMLQHLNLSNNRLVSVTAIKWLPNLKSLNLNFNRLTEIPLFHADTSRRLQVLLIANNYVEDLTGVTCLDGLCELDLSMNCLLDHSTLLPVSTLAALQYLNLKGNPMSCHPKHRQVSAAYLHKNTSSGVVSFEWWYTSF